MISTVNALEQRLEDVVTPLDVSIIGCVVNGPGEAMVSTLGVAGSSKNSAFYIGGVRQKERICNDNMIDEMENRIRTYLASLNEPVT